MPIQIIALLFLLTLNSAAQITARASSSWQIGNTVIPAIHLNRVNGVLASPTQLIKPGDELEIRLYYFFTGSNSGPQINLFQTQDIQWGTKSEVQLGWVYPNGVPAGIDLKLKNTTDFVSMGYFNNSVFTYTVPEFLDYSQNGAHLRLRWWINYRPNEPNRDDYQFTQADIQGGSIVYEQFITLVKDSFHFTSEGGAETISPQSGLLNVAFSDQSLPSWITISGQQFTVAPNSGEQRQANLRVSHHTTPAVEAWVTVSQDAGQSLQEKVDEQLNLDIKIIDGAAEVSFNTIPNMRHTVQYSEDLKDWFAVPVLLPVTGDGTRVTQRDAILGSVDRNSRLFYRVLVE